MRGDALTLTQQAVLGFFATIIGLRIAAIVHAAFSRASA